MLQMVVSTRQLPVWWTRCGKEVGNLLDENDRRPLDGCFFGLVLLMVQTCADHVAQYMPALYTTLLLQ